MAKTSKAKSPAPSPAPLVAQEHGGALRVGNPGNGGGRPKEVWRRRVREALEQAEGVEFLVRVVKGEVVEKVVDEDGQVVEIPPKLRDRIIAANILIEQAHGKPPQEVTLEDERPRPTGEQIMARILELLPRVVAVLPLERKELARLLAERRRVEVLVQGKEITR